LEVKASLLKDLCYENKICEIHKSAAIRDSDEL